MKKNWKYGSKILLLALPLCLTVAMTSLAEKSADNMEGTDSYDTGVTLASPSQAYQEEPENDQEEENLQTGWGEQELFSSKVMLQSELENFIPAENVKWDETRPGWVTWNMESLSEEEKHEIKRVAIQVYRDDEPVGYQEWNDLTESDLRSHLHESGDYQFKVVLSKNRRIRDIDKEGSYWSDLSEPYHFSKEAVVKKMPKPEKVECLSNGIIRWKAGSEKEAYKRANSYRVNVYVKLPSGEYELSDYNTTYGESYNCLPVVEDGEAYQFEIIALGDFITYANSDPSEKVEFTVGEAVGTGTSIITNMNQGNVKDNIEKANLSAAEKGTLQTATQMNSGAADEYANLEETYRDAAGKNTLEVNHDESIITEPPTVIGAILNGATGVKFEKSSSVPTGYVNYLAVDITLEGSGISGELRFPVLITIATPEGMEPEDLVIIHVKHDGTRERIYPRINEDGTVSFAVTQFSTFFFIDESSKETGSSNGSNNSNSSGGRLVSSQKSGGASKVTETPGQWQQTDAGWQFRKPSGELYQNTWVFVKGKWYWIEPTSIMAQGWKELNGKKYYLVPVSGEMKTSWLLDNNCWYYLEESGAMKTGWALVSGKWYYLNEDGKMASDTVTPDGYKVGTDGAWLQ
ncbi:MAG: hypothetical protein QM657_07235 [Lacrimispora sp.]|uniref:N-acetylmuramoyl-L-alanine amidase family protein n=1 Tax=Lacrimispora sp. TaxID=2719234 RepID=UPI0039E608CA